MPERPILIWYRQDLRTAGHPALHAAAQTACPILPVYIWAPEEEGPWAAGGASKVWLHESLARLDDALGALGSRLVFRYGPALEALAALIEETNAGAVYWNRRYEPAARARDASVKQELGKRGVDAKSFNGSLLFEPWEVETQQGGPYKVFTPFWKACQKQAEPPAPVPAPEKLAAPTKRPYSLKLDDLRLRPGIPWDKGIRRTWTPGEEAAHDRLQGFAREAAAAYDGGHDRPDQDGTSRLSPHLHFGELSPHQVWHTIMQATEPGKGAVKFLSEVGWREFAHHLLYHFPETPVEPLRPEFRAFPWRKDPRSLEAWQQGKTGYPMVDAGMRQLWETGWMHNRVRMLAASFLTKHLLIPWQEGARWFWDTLVDADLANNTLGWQWTAGCGADAAPYFRIFNPFSQGEKFDPQGDYVRRYVPELAGLPNRWLHRPWDAPVQVLRDAGVRLGETYPEPVVDHFAARDRALAAYETIKKG